MPEKDTIAYEDNHVWLIAAAIRLHDLALVRRAVLRHSVRLPAQVRIDVLEVYCGECRRTYHDVADEPCIAASTNEHLRGGPIGERRKRAHRKHNCELLGCFPPALPGDSDSATGTG